MTDMKNKYSWQCPFNEPGRLWLVFKKKRILKAKTFDQTTPYRNTNHWPFMLKLWRSSSDLGKYSSNRKPATACIPYILVHVQMNYVIRNSVKTVWSKAILKRLRWISVQYANFYASTNNSFINHWKTIHLQFS